MHTLGPGVSAGPRAEWLVTPAPNPSAAVRLVCFPSAGHGPAMFRPWLPLLPSHVELSIAHLPGRESRWSEPPISSVEEVARIVAEVTSSDGSRPVALFGHSLGALIAFEVARQLRATVGREPVHLFASAHRATHLPHRYPRIAGLDDRAFILEVHSRHGGVPPEVADNQELMDLMVPNLKADYRLFEHYVYAEGPPLTCPVTALGGTQDAHVTETELQAWESQTSGPFAMRLLDGGHFFVNDVRPTVVAGVLSDLQGAIA